MPFGSDEGLRPRALRGPLSGGFTRVSMPFGSGEGLRREEVAAELRAHDRFYALRVGREFATRGRHGAHRRESFLCPSGRARVCDAALATSLPVSRCFYALRVGREFATRF